MTATPLDLVLLDGLTHRPASVLAGFKTAIVDKDNSHIPALWGRLFENAGKPGQKGWISLGVCWPDASDESTINDMAAF